MKKIILVLITMLTFTVSKATVLTYTYNAQNAVATPDAIYCSVGDTVVLDITNALPTQKFICAFGNQFESASAFGNWTFTFTVNAPDINGSWQVSDVGDGINFYNICNGYLFDNTTGIKEVSKLSVNVYPNPTSDYINVKLDEPVKNISLYDLSGKLVLSVSDVNQVDVSNLSKGSYSLKVSTDKSTAIKSVILN